MERDAEEIMGELLEHGTMPSAEEVIALCAVAVEAERQQEKWEGLERALAREGYRIVDMTTDDDDGTVLHIVRIEEPADG
jgi:glucosamine 6-phosphate synthetase-like amidotransferase/phosphosugar isomerase protein